MASAWSRISSHARALDWRELVRGVVRGYDEHDILSYAAAISFQVCLALIPLALFALGLLGFVQLHEVWRQDTAPAIQPNLSPAAFQVIDSTAIQVLTQGQLFWITLGAALAVWEVSGATWTTMRIFNSIYGVEETRSAWRRVAVSLALAAAVSPLLLLAAIVVRFGGLPVEYLLGSGPAVGAVSFVVRWGVAAGLLFLVIGILVRFAPAKRRPIGWVGFGSIVVVGSWIATSLVFGWYVTSVADYASVFGNLATVFVTLLYLYISSLAFLTGVQIDTLARQQLEGGGRS
ncbi:MAG: YihY/virulence factor BrkB family protein [Actinomycetota bacterium]|nr:YihY/virulence factor BrkB family protein [Actinomycetota bacterium]